MTGHKEEKNRDCSYCLYWKKSKGCTYEGKTTCCCAPEDMEPVTECTACPYGRHYPCIGWCTKEAMRSLGLPMGRDEK